MQGYNQSMLLDLNNVGAVDLDLDFKAWQILRFWHEESIGKVMIVSKLQ